MSTIYVIDNTSGDLNITIAPGTLNGPGSGHRDSDLRLYGMGALLWGEGVGENFLRLAETFAVNAKELNDFNPSSGLDDYDPSVDPVLPKDESDLGPGFGITNPLNGQQWFNNTNKTVYVFDGLASTWSKISAASVGTTPPLNPFLGQTWFDTNLTNVCNQAELKIYNPSHPDAESGFIGVAADYVSSCGDNMSGILNMSDDGGITRHKITNLETPTNDPDAATKLYVDEEVSAVGNTSTAHITDTDVHLDTEQNLFMDTLTSTCMSGVGSGVDMATDLCHLSGWHASTGTVYVEVQSKISNTGDALISGFISLTSASPTDDLHAVSRGWVNNQIQSIPSPPTEFPAGTVLIFPQPAAPSGWTQITTHNDKMIRVVNGSGGGSGGTDSPILMDKVPAHTHTGSADTVPNHRHGVGGNQWPWGGGDFYSAHDNTAAFHGSVASQSFIGWSGWEGSHGHTMTINSNAGASNWTPKYLDTVIASKDA